jgi:hypothetical protein
MRVKPPAGVLAERLAAQMLAGTPAGNPLEVAHRLLAIQGQDPRGARLAVRARSTGLSAHDVDRALTEERALVITWLNRGTLHLLASEDYRWLHALTAPTLFTASARRLSQEGVTPAAADRGRALAELARRYLAGHAPAEDRDLARWSGLRLRDARAGLAAIASELHEREDGLLELSRRPAPAQLPPPRLLGAFDPLLLGWRSREALLDANHQRIVTVNGIFRPFALVRGRAVATWTIAAGKVVLKPFAAALAHSDERALRADARDVVRYLRLGV